MASDSHDSADEEPTNDHDDRQTIQEEPEEAVADGPEFAYRFTHSDTALRRTASRRITPCSLR